MTKKELELELICYRNVYNPTCDINNLSLEEIADFISKYILLLKH